MNRALPISRSIIMDHAWQALAVLVGEALAKRWLACANKPTGKAQTEAVGHKPDAIAEQSKRAKPGQHGLENEGQ